jgi:hypothetical protein
MAAYTGAPPRYALNPLYTALSTYSTYARDSWLSLSCDVRSPVKIVNAGGVTLLAAPCPFPFSAFAMPVWGRVSTCVPDVEVCFH